jgi:hypothetical protein
MQRVRHFRGHFFVAGHHLCINLIQSRLTLKHAKSAQAGHIPKLQAAPYTFVAAQQGDSGELTPGRVTQIFSGSCTRKEIPSHYFLQNCNSAQI